MGSRPQLTFLGTGTSQGVPVIGCTCHVCRSNDPRDKRLRTAALLTLGTRSVVIDAGPDFRQEMLRAGAPDVQAILLTHEHNDHVGGLDDVRPYNFMQHRDMPIYCVERVAADLRRRYAYAFAENPYPGAPGYRLQTISRDEVFEVAGFSFQPVEVLHGGLPVLGFRTGSLAYLTDVRTIAPAELQKIRGCRTLVINALHHTEHYSHLSLQQALELIGEIEPEQAYLIHMSHRMGLHAEVEAQLPPGVQLAYDGLVVDV